MQNYYDNYPVDSNNCDYEIDSQAEAAFSKGLAAAIMAWFPITSIIAIFMGLAASKLAAQTEEMIRRLGAENRGKNSAAKVLSKVGWIGGIAMSCFWLFYGSIFFIYFMVVFLAVIAGM